MGAESAERLEKILSNWRRASERGEAPDPEELIRSHPDLADQLRARFAEMRELDRLFEADAAAAQLPARIGHYRIVRLLGRGSMGVVYEAEQEDLKRRIALKVLSPVIANDMEAVARFSREAQAAARLDHPHIAAVHELGRDGAFLYYSMELVEGPSLHDWIQARRAGHDLPGLEVAAREQWTWLARVFVAAANALHAAHEMDVVHRDVKPSNILITADGSPKIVDFGLARIGGTGETLTSPGTLLGTLLYMSPEQAQAAHGEIDRRSDVYSLGAAFYEALTLTPPFEGEDPVELLRRILSEEPPAPRRVRREIPKDLETITIKAMAKEPRGRYATAHAFAEDLRRYLADEPIEARRPGPLARVVAAARRGRGRAALPAGVALAVAAALFVLLGGLPPSRPGPDIAEGMTLRTYAPPAVDALEESGVAAHAAVGDWLGFLLPEEGIGTVVAAQTPGGGRARDDLCAFDMQRDLLWSARGSWPDFDETLGSADARIDSMRCVVTRSATPDPEETLLVSTHYRGHAHLLFLDPVTGRRQGEWAMPSAFGAEPIQLGVLGMIPESRTAPRRLIVGCTRRRPDGSGRPCAILLEPDGTFAACYELPALGFEAVTDLGLVAAKCDWSRDRPEIELVTTEGIFCAFLVREGLLDVTSVRVVLNDTIGEYYDAEFGEGSFDDLVEAKGGHLGLLDHLAAEISEETG